jgi:ubiquitin-like 1-activating enzyme E1 A
MASAPAISHTSTDASQPQNLLSADAAKLYDRQIRLWGAASQTRMQAATIVFVGITGLASEVAKNVVLAGVQNITLLDWHRVLPRDLSAQLLLDASSVGQNVRSFAMTVKGGFFYLFSSAR